MATKPQSAKPKQDKTQRQQESAGRRDRNAVSEMPGDKPRQPEWVECPTCSKRNSRPVTCQRRNEWRGL